MLFPPPIPDDQWDGTPKRISLPELHAGREFAANYLPCPYPLSEYRNLARPYTRLTVEEFGLSVDELLLCLAIITREGTHLQLERWEATEAFLLTGFLRFPRRLLHQMLYAGVRAWSSEFGIAASPMSVVNRFLASMLLTSDRARDLDLHAGWLPSPLYKVSPDWVVADWLFMDHLLNLFIIGASSQDEMKETKVHRLEADLENWVLKRAKTSGFGVSRLLRRNQHLRLNAQEYGELDISMIRGSVGYIVDCKAYRVSIGCLLLWRMLLHTEQSLLVHGKGAEEGHSDFADVGRAPAKARQLPVARRSGTPDPPGLFAVCRTSL